MAKQLTYLIATAIIRRGDEVLLVKQQGPGEPAPHWALPGGRVEAGEILPEGLAREVREETGLTVLNPGRLAYITQLDNPSNHVWVGGENANAASQATAFVFEVAEWSGEPLPADPDGHVQECRFFLAAEAARLVAETVPWRIMREPTVAYLRGEVATGSLWVFRRAAANVDDLVCRLPQ